MTALTSDVQTALAPAASELGHTVDSLGDSIYNVTTGTYHGVVQYGKQATGGNTTASNSTAATQVTPPSSLIGPPASCMLLRHCSLSREVGHKVAQRLKVHRVDPQNTTVDATNATSVINAITTNSSGFVSVANSLLVALGQQKSSAVESGIANVVNNQTGNMSYPAKGPTREVRILSTEHVFIFSACLNVAGYLCAYI